MEWIFQHHSVGGVTDQEVQVTSKGTTTTENGYQIARTYGLKDEIKFLTAKAD